MRVAHRADLANLGGRAVEVRQQYDPGLGMKAKGLLQRLGVHVPGVALGVHEHAGAALVGHRVHRRVEGQVRADHLAAGEAATNACAHARGGAIHPAGRELHGEVQHCRAGAKGHGMGHSAELGHLALDLVNVGAHGAHPVCLVGLGHEAQQVAMHGGRAEPEALRQRGESS